MNSCKMAAQIKNSFLIETELRWLKIHHIHLFISVQMVIELQNKWIYFYLNAHALQPVYLFFIYTEFT